MSTASEMPYVEGVHLQRTDENVREIAALAEVLGEPTGLDGLLGDLKYDVRPARVVPRLLGRAVREAYRWDDYEDHPWAVVSDAPGLMLEVLVDAHDGWLDEGEEQGPPLPPLDLPASPRRIKKA